MLNEIEINSLAQTLKLNKDITRECVKNLFSKYSTVIDGKIVDKEIVCNFLRMCIKLRFMKSNNFEELSEIFTIINQFFIENFKSDPIETLIYFFDDCFFAPVLHYLIDRIVLNETFIEPKNFDISRHPVPNFYEVLVDVNYFYISNLSESKEYTVDGLAEIFAGRVNIGIDTYTLNIAPDLINHIGFRIFESRIFRDSIIEHEKMRRDKSLNEITRSLVKFRSARNKKKNYFLYCLCEKLYLENFGRRKSFKIVATSQSVPWKTVHRRFYDVQKEMKKNGIRFKDLIELRHKELFNKSDKSVFESRLEYIKSLSDIDAYISE